LGDVHETFAPLPEMRAPAILSVSVERAPPGGPWSYYLISFMPACAADPATVRLALTASAASSDPVVASHDAAHER
jgi:hypothetical protein